MGSRISFGSKIQDPAFAIVSATGTAETGFEPENVQNPRLDKTWRAPTGAATRTLTVEYYVSQKMFWVMVVAPARKPIVGNITVRLVNSVGTVLTSGTIGRMAHAALDRRIFSVGGSGLSSVKKIEVEIPAGQEIARVVADVESFLDLYVPRTAIGDDWSIEPIEPVRIQQGTTSAHFAETARPSGSGYLAPVRKRRMQVTLVQVTNFPYLLRSLPLADIDEVGVLINQVDSRTATTAQIEDMHARSIYGRAAPPNFRAVSLDGAGSPYGDRYDVRLTIDERA